MSNVLIFLRVMLILAILTTSVHSGLFINNKFIPSGNSHTIQITNPTNWQQTSSSAQRIDIDNAANGAESAFEQWKAAPPSAPEKTTVQFCGFDRARCRGPGLFTGTRCRYPVRRLYESPYSSGPSRHSDILRDGQINRRVRHFIYRVAWRIPSVSR